MPNLLEVLELKKRSTCFFFESDVCHAERYNDFKKKTEGLIWNDKVNAKSFLIPLFALEVS